MSDQQQRTLMIKFAEALNAVENVAKTQTADTGKYSYKYADLGDVLDECKRACQMFGLAVSQHATVDSNGMLVVGTQLIDCESGESHYFLPLTMKMPPDAQALGSALTYGRRYSLLAIFGIAPEDDDGRAATIAAQAQPGRRTEAERMIRELMGEMDPDVQAEFVKDFKAEFHTGLSDLPASQHGRALTWTREWLASPLLHEAPEGEVLAELALEPAPEEPS